MRASMPPGWAILIHVMRTLVVNSAVVAGSFVSLYVMSLQGLFLSGMPHMAGWSGIGLPAMFVAFTTPVVALAWCLRRRRAGLLAVVLVWVYAFLDVVGILLTIVEFEDAVDTIRQAAPAVVLTITHVIFWQAVAVKTMLDARRAASTPLRPVAVRPDPSARRPMARRDTAR